MPDKIQTKRKLRNVSAGTSLLAAFVILLGQHWYAERARLADQVAVQAAIVGSNASAAMVFEDQGSATEILSALGRSPIVREAALYRGDGALMARFRAAPAPRDEPLLAGTAPPLGATRSWRGVSLVEAVKLENRTVGFIALRASLEAVYLDLAWFAANLAVIVLVSLGLARLVSRRLRKRMAEAETALTESENRFRGLFEKSSSVMLLVDPTDSRIISANQAALNYYGYTSESMLGMSADRLNTLTPAEMYRERQRAMRGERSYFNYRHRLASGEPRDVEIYASPVEVGGKSLLFSIIHDITARKLAEQSLRESESRFRLMFERTADALLLLDPTAGQFIDCNRAAAVMLRFPDGEEMLPLRPDELSPGRQPDGRASSEKAADMIATALRNGSHRFEWIHCSAYRKDFPVEVLLTPIMMGEQQLIITTWRDITENKRAEELLKESEFFFKESQRAAYIGSYKFNFAADIWESSGVLDEIFGIDQNYRRTTQGWFDIVHPDDRKMIRQYMNEGVRTRRGKMNKDYRIVRQSDGEVRWVIGLGEMHFSEDGWARSMIGTVQDITERKQDEARLQLAASVFSHAREGITICDAVGTIVDVNEAFTRITGYSREEALGQSPRMLKSGRHAPDFYAAMWQALTDVGHWTGEIWNRHKDGSVYAELITISAVCDAQGRTRSYVALFTDITPMKEHQQQLEHIAHYDALTSLPNRVLLADRLQQAMAQAQRREQPLAVAYLDLDGFKQINDRYGHDAGDQLLMAVATRMKQALRDGDTLARLGGDEFVAVLLDLADVAACEPMLSRLLVAAALPVQVGDLALQVSASLGVTFYPQPEEVDADQMLRQADQAMYQAKVAGKNRYHVFDAEQDRSVRGHHESLERIRRALDEDEFVLHYQPKVNMRLGTVIGAEALIRWQHPERGLLAPAVFLPVIEDHLLAIKLGEWVIDSALTQMERWHAAGLNIPVSVNVGARQLQQADFVDRLRKILAAHPQVGPGDLAIEVLETSALEDLARISQVIGACREFGVSFALDDFGTGYSSLTYLKHLPISMLKIDQSFVRNMLDDPDDLAILEGVLGLAHAFHREVIAEGVETLEHGVMLLQLGCELAQGYGIARPMPEQEFSAWSANWRPDPAWADLPQVSSDDLPLLFASAEHKAWIAAIESHLRGGHDAMPPLDQHLCRFGVWLESRGSLCYGSHPVFETIGALHQQLHALATELGELPAAGRNPEVLARMGELHELGNALINQLAALTMEMPAVRDAEK